MFDFIDAHYDWFRALHIIAVIAWMAGLLYLPRLFVYHAGAKIGSELSETLKIMERKLLNFIMHPAMILSWVFGLLMLIDRWELFKTMPWMHAKLGLIVLMTAFHHALMIYVKKFAQDKNTKTDTFYRILNEVPTVLMILIVILAVAEPF